jgi:hypothetical protein
MFENCLRNEGREECLKELSTMEKEGETFYAASGEVLKLSGVLRAADIFWNPQKK